MAYNRGSILSNMPPVTKNLLIINVLMWLATMVFGNCNIIDLQQYLGLHFWLGSDFNPAQLVTYMFMHDSTSFSSGISHIFFNMFSLWMFGTTLERVMGGKRFLFYYVSCGIGAALVQELSWQLTWTDMLSEAALMQGVPASQVSAVIQQWVADGQVDLFYNQLVTVGASGAVFGILLAFGMLFPNLPMYIIPIPIPIKAKWMVLGYGLVELFFGVTGELSHVAHFAHLGGMLVGFVMIYVWKKKNVIGGGNGLY